MIRLKLNARARVLSSLLLLSGSSAGLAEPPAQPSSAAEPPKPASTAPAPRVSGTEELDQLRTQNALLAEQVKAWEMKNKMGLIVPGIDQAAPIPLAGGGAAPAARPAGARGTVVTMVAGQKERGLVATLQTADGGTVAVRVGDSVPGLGKVKSIETNRVVVESGKSAISVPFAAEPTSAAIQGAQSARAPMAMPMLPLPGTTRN